MKRILALLLWPLVASICSAADVLEERIPFAPTLEEVVKKIWAVEERLPKEHLYAFKLGRSELIDPLRYELTGLTQEERDVVALRSIAGLTVRQIILIGQQVRILRASINAAKHPDDAKDMEAEIRDSTKILRRYAKGANQSPQRNAGAGPATPDKASTPHRAAPSEETARTQTPRG
jgi:hypothetical protein